MTVPQNPVKILEMQGPFRVRVGQAILDPKRNGFGIATRR